VKVVREVECGVVCGSEASGRAVLPVRSV